MSGGLLIEYTYDGDEDAWRAAINTFIGHIRDDERLDGTFSYLVVRSKADPTHRIHMPRWIDPETLAHVQSKDWFQTFAGQVRAFAGDSLKTTPLSPEFDSREL
jgi:quinol monooxygenase YgiN